jgi:hypothetical protein
LSAVAGASADSAMVSISVSSSPAPTSTPAPCDLVANGKCYGRIVDRTAQNFLKYVVPNSVCSGDPPLCQYVDSIDHIELGPPFTLRPARLPTDSSRELLFRIDGIQSASIACLPFAAIANIPTSQVLWGPTGTGGPANPPLGFGEPSKYVALNHLSFGPTGGAVNAPTVWPEQTTALDMYEAVASQRVGAVETFTYSATNISSSDVIGWFPDFPGCDVVGDRPNLGAQYGIVQVELVFEIFQAAL